MIYDWVTWKFGNGNFSFVVCEETGGAGSAFYRAFAKVTVRRHFALDPQVGRPKNVPLESRSLFSGKGDTVVPTDDIVLPTGTLPFVPSFRFFHD
jgi:hypothetical protein